MTISQEKPSYLCTNPNCGKVFAKPKIIKYYVCPTCQTLIIMDTEIARSNQEIMNHDSTIDEDMIHKRKRKQKIKETKTKDAESLVTLQVSHTCEKAESILSSNLSDLEDMVPVNSSKVFDYRSETAIREPKMEKADYDLSEKPPFVIDSKPEIELASSDKTTVNDDLSIKSSPVVVSQPETLDNEPEPTKTSDLAVPISVHNSGIIGSESENVTSESKEVRMYDDLSEKHPFVINSQSEKEIVKPENTKTDDDLIRDYVQLTTNADLRNTSAEENSKANDVDKKSSENGFTCYRHFGYLSERDKGEQIPEHCFGCSKSIECMLESNESSNKKVAGIKQWYLTE